jgi:hypothetical protein
MTRITIKFDVDKAQKLGERLGLLSGEQIAAITVPVVNQVAERTYNLAREKITTGINLSDDYLKRRFTVRKATPSNPTATITALGNPGSMTPLGRYDARMVLVPKKDPRNRGKGKLPLNRQPTAWRDCRGRSKPAGHVAVRLCTTAARWQR